MCVCVCMCVLCEEGQTATLYCTFLFSFCFIFLEEHNTLITCSFWLFDFVRSHPCSVRRRLTESEAMSRRRQEDRSDGECHCEVRACETETPRVPALPTLMSRLYIAFDAKCMCYCIE